MQACQGVGHNLTRVGLICQIRIAVQIILGNLLKHIIDKMPQQVGARRRTKTNRIGHAVRTHRNTIMRDARRDIQDIAGFKHPFVGRFKFCEQL